ncbi:insulinase family protein [Erysipelothrix sp. HDW6C]|uniref:M16 family metallopeptidase n=1 Tax=Erysipelothrix sp. HDW6C TaxID=2714930 RepID=UPI00140E21A2|nr:insulinase family protein [Erysipelothrix sp. HDW6C]QIK70190.1 insulinase family protein [Erysipelothrix sp. HDW6C]
MNEHIKLPNNLDVHILREPKFHEVLMNLKVYFKLEAHQNTVANLLMRMMDDRIESHTTKNAMTKRLDMLYGTKTSSQTYTNGWYQVIDLSVKTINSKYTQEDLTAKQLELLADMFFNPLLNEDTLKEAKTNLKLQFARIKESSAHYAQFEAFKRSAPHQVFSLNSMGEVDAVNDVTLDEVKAFHQRLIQEAGKQLFLVGDIKQVPSFERFNVGHCAEAEIPLLDTKVTPRYEEVFHPGNQTELVLVFDTPIDPFHELYAAYLVFVACLGQLPSSLLFQNIREKHSLAYSIYASRQMFDSIMYIATGINDANLEKTLTLIDEQLQNMATADLDVDAAKQYLIMGLEGATEHMKRIADQAFRNIMLQTDETVAEMQENIKNVTEADVRAVLQTISKPYVFAYRGENHEEN